MGEMFVYGARCCWWDSLDKTSRLPEGLPCCPHCGSVLFQVDPIDWWAGVDKYERNGHPGYKGFVEWLRGKHFRNKDDAQVAYDGEKR